MNFFAGVAASIIVGALVSAITIISGAFDVAAIVPDSGLKRVVLHLTMRRSVQAHAGAGFQETWSDEQIRDGFEDYNAMCIICHAAPGKERSSISHGMNPQPPLLADAAKNWSGGETFWIVKNGIKMTGMPAFGLTHSDDQIWNIVGFVRRLPQTSADEYEQMRERWEGHDARHTFH
jgi:mono/diheme cytochrome c family protein